MQYCIPACSDAVLCACTLKQHKISLEKVFLSSLPFSTRFDCFLPNKKWELPRLKWLKWVDWNKMVLPNPARNRMWWTLTFSGTAFFHIGSCFFFFFWDFNIILWDSRWQDKYRNVLIVMDSSYKMEVFHLKLSQLACWILTKILGFYYCATLLMKAERHEGKAQVFYLTLMCLYGGGFLSFFLSSWSCRSSFSACSSRNRTAASSKADKHHQQLDTQHRQVNIISTRNK